MHPLLVRHLLYPLHERLKGKPTFEWLRRLERTQWLAPERLMELQLTRLRDHLAFADQHVPYYRRLFAEHDVVPARIQTLQDFQRVPSLTRDLLRSQFDGLAADVCMKGRLRRATGGSSGSPVFVLIDAERMGVGEGMRLRSHRWFGLEPGAREVVLWGSPIEITKQDRIRSIRDRILNTVLLSAFDMSEAALARYADFIARRQPEKMYGYASAFYLLARYLQTTRWQPPRTLKAIFTTAEPLFDFQRKVVEDAFECRVATEYGSRDAGLTANECPEGSLHIPAEGILVEIEGAGPDGAGEIVVTNLYSPSMPIIRYRTGDLGRLDSTPCPCGRTLPRIKAVEGRRTDFLVAADGRVLHALAIIYVLRDTPGLREFRVVQETVDHITIQVLPESPLSPVTIKTLIDRVRQLLGQNVEVAVEPVSAMPVTPSGKFRYVTSRVADGHLDSMLGTTRAPDTGAAR